MKILLTGHAGFIGFHLTSRLLKNKLEVVGIDNLNPYYDTELKRKRLELLNDICLKQEKSKLTHLDTNLEDTKEILKIFRLHSPDVVINLAAQAGVRYSIENPYDYIQSNLVGFHNILEGCRSVSVKNLIYASSSSVYGGNTKLPFSEDDPVNHPVSLYAATKKSNELMAHSYSHLYNIPTIGLRFFTVYGPWGRPDMALYLFTKAIFENKPINVYNNGEMIRDFTYIDDIIESIIRLIDKPPSSSDNFESEALCPSISWAPYKIFNIGNSQPIQLMDYIETLEKVIGKEAVKNYMPLQQGDVPITESTTHLLEKYIDFRPNTDKEEGIKQFVQWYKNYHNIN